jgi:hypothetical protein
MDLFSDMRKPLSEIIKIPPAIQSVYSLTRHIWEGETAEELKTSKRINKFRIETIDELLIDPVRDFFQDFLDHIQLGEGQGWWVMADRGSGKSHLLSAATILALGDKSIWDLIAKKEEAQGTEKRASLNQFADGVIGKKIFPVTRDLVGVGGPGISKGLIDYILDSAAETYEIITGKPLPVYPEQYLAERFLKKDRDLYRSRLKAFLEIPRNLEGLPKYTFDTLLDALQDPSEQKDAGSVLWKFYRDDLGILQLDIPVERIERLEHLVRRLLAEGYDGVLFVLDEVSEYMETDRERRFENEDTLLVLGEKLAKDKRLPVWTLCAAQTYIESQKIGSKIIAPDRLKQVDLLEKERSYYEIVLSRTREVKDESQIQPYYDFYKRIAPWPEVRGLDDFRFFFPFYPDAIDIIRIISFKLTTTRSALHFMHRGLQRTIEQNSRDLLSLWNVFEDLIQYEEAPSGGGPGVLSVRTKFPSEYRAYEMAQKALQGVSHPYLNEYKTRAQKVMNTLFLYYLAGRPGLKPLEVLNSVLEPRSSEATQQENEEHYGILLEELEKRIPQITVKDGAYSFQETGKEDYQSLYDQARRELLEKEALFNRFYVRLLVWQDDERKHYGLFFELAQERLTPLEFLWHNQERRGRAGLMDLSDPDKIFLPELNSPETDDDFLFIASKYSTPEDQIRKILEKAKEERTAIWIPRSLTNQEKEDLVRILAFLKLKEDYQGRQTEVVEWADKNMREDIPRALKIVESLFSGGKAIGLGISFQPGTQGGFQGAFTRVAGHVLDNIYASGIIDCPRQFKRDDAAKLINGIIRYGEVKETKGANASAAENFSLAFGLTKVDNSKQLDPSASPFYLKMLHFVQDTDSSRFPIRTFYKRYVGGENGLTRRMVDIYLMALVQAGVLIAEMKDGKQIDRSNIQEMEFTTSLLNNLSEMTKPKAPEFWDKILPFVSTMVEEAVPSIYDDRVTSDIIKKVRDLFEKHRLGCRGLMSRVDAFYGEISRNNQFSKILAQFFNLFSEDISECSREESVMRIAKGLTACLGKDVSETTELDIEDFKKSWVQYKGLYNVFDKVKDNIRAALRYAEVSLPEDKNLLSLKKELEFLSNELKDISPFLIDETEYSVRLKPTFESLKSSYFDLYREVHSKICFLSDSLKKKIEDAKISKDWIIVRIFAENIGPLKSLKEEAEKRFQLLLDITVDCDIRDEINLRRLLESGPLCNCGLNFVSASGKVKTIEESSKDVAKIPLTFLHILAEFLLKDEVKTKLSKGEDKKLAPILKAKASKDLEELLRAYSEKDLSLIANKINTFLGDVRVKRVPITRFRPKTRLVSQNEIDVISEEFKAFIRSYFKEPGDVIEILES